MAIPFRDLFKKYEEKLEHIEPFQRVILDETHVFPAHTDDDDDLSHIQSVVRITFNRPLTWAEREFFYEMWRSDREIVGWIFKACGRQLYISSREDSRDIVEVISTFVEHEYLNVFPKAVWTIYPEVRV